MPLIPPRLVRARRKDGELTVIGLDDKSRGRAHALAGAFLDVARRNQGQPRSVFDEACANVSVSTRDRRLALGLLKLVEDRCEWEADAIVPPVELRREVFLRAAQAWRAIGPGHKFDRSTVLVPLAKERQVPISALSKSLYADLRNAQVLHQTTSTRPEALVAEYELVQTQSVLLCAVKVSVEVWCQQAAQYRGLFRKLKFLRLLYSLRAKPKGGYEIEIDGPFSLFESVSKYGLQLALALPAIAACDRFKLVGRLRWGKQREPLLFRLEGGSGRGIAADEDLPEEVARLLSALAGEETPWRAAPANVILSLPGVGLCVPDLVFVHEKSGQRVYLEVLGYWSRDAVWRRVELCERGLKEKILFAVSAHLRVSEAALPESVPGALYVYKRTMSASQVLDRVGRLASRQV